MKDQKQSHEHEKEAKHSGSGEKGQQGQAKPADPSKAENIRKEQEAHKVDTSKLDHHQLADFSHKVEADPVLNAKFQADPHGTLKENGVSIPEGYRATHDNQYVKSSDGANRVVHSYGPVKVVQEPK